MAFVRKRKKKGNTYYELVKSVREGDKVRQKFLEYLGSETQAREFCREREDINFPGPEKKPLDKQIKEKKEEFNSLRTLPKEKNLKKLEDDPYPGSGSGNEEKLPVEGEKRFRMHIGRTWTVFYSVLENEKEVHVSEILPIDEAHKKYGY